MTHFVRFWTAVAGAAQRVAQLGDPALANLARSAMRKLAFDLPVDVSVRESAPVYLSVAAPSAAEILEELDDALRRRKHVTIEYHTFGSDVQKSRVVSPVHCMLNRCADAVGLFGAVVDAGHVGHGIGPPDTSDRYPAGFDLRSPPPPGGRGSRATQAASGGRRLHGSSGPTVAGRL
jgi:hypothetical protein